MTERITELYELYRESPVVVTDSRKIVPGCLFFALKGDNFNGNDFAETALNRGASIAVVDDKKYKNNKGCFVVDDVLDVLQELAGFHREHLKGKIIAITGTNGKTTTKELIRAVLNEKYKVQATEGNFNNHIGVPLTLLKMPVDLNFGIVEMGANHPGEIAALCQIAKPDFGLITNVGKAHLEGFGSLQGVLNAKTELYQFLKETDGKVFVNRDNEMLWERSSALDTITYGKTPDAFYRGRIHRDFPELSLEINLDGQFRLANTHLIGAYNFENILAAACIGSYFAVSGSDIVHGIESYVPDNMRSQIIQSDTNSLVLDAYNANPTSMAAALESFAQLDKPDKMLILGEMAELGSESEVEHEHLVREIIQKGFGEVWLVGSKFKVHSGTSIRHFESTQALIDHLKMDRPKNKTILIKGSRSNQLEQIIPHL